MRGMGWLAGLAMAAACVGTASAESGSFFKNMFGGGGGSESGGGEAAVGLGMPKAMDPSEVYCPTVSIAEGAAALPSYAGASDSAHLRHQIVIGRISRECALRPDGGLSVKVGVQIRALLGPAGSSGTFQAPLAIAIKANDKVVDSRSRTLSVAIPLGSAQGMASVIEDGLLVPAKMTDNYDIEVALGGQARAKASAKTAAKRRKPATNEAAAATSEAPVAGE